MLGYLYTFIGINQLMYRSLAVNRPWAKKLAHIILWGVGVYTVIDYRDI